MFRVLSYPLTSHGPVWPGNPQAAVTEPFESTAKGDMANTTILHLFSHSSTHLDAPFHFNPEGLPAHRLPIEDYIFFSPLVIETPLPEGGFITLETLQPVRDALAGADLVLFRTGWSAIRDTDVARYGGGGPLLHPDAARFLMDKFPGLRAVGIDTISIGSPAHIPETVATHQILTGKGRADGRFILIFEDMRIDPDLGEARRVYAWPLFIEESDGSPCTMVAEFEDV